MSSRQDSQDPGERGAFSHLVAAGLAGFATLGPDGTVRSREGALSAWLPEIGTSCFDSPVLSGLDGHLDEMRGSAAEPLVLPAVRLAGVPAARRCHIMISWQEGAGEHAVLTTVDQIDRPIDHWILLQKREQRLLEEQLAVASREIERKNQDLREFTSIAAHDLQAPLRQIVSFASLLKGTIGDHPEQALDCIETIEGCATRLTRMITGLLDQARLSSQQLELMPMALTDAVVDACRNLSGEIAGCDAQVDIGELPEALGSPSLVTNLFQNLIANSLRYRAPERRPHISIAMARRGPSIEIAITDNGIGVPPTFAKTIFGSFVRVPQADSSESVGLGLGLCRKIAELHGWTIDLDVDHTPGARFVIVISPYFRKMEHDRER